jgi:hypothetical protein
MFFLIRMAFWLSVVLVLLPSGGSKQTASTPGAEIGALGAVSAASATVSDMRQFCTRQPDACAIGSQAAVAFGQRAQAGAKMVYELINEHAAPRETGSIATKGTKPAVALAAKPSQNTLTPADLAPAWRGPQRDVHIQNGA